MTATNKIRTNVYLDAEIKEKAKEVFKHYNIGLSDAFNIFLAQTVLERGLPFEVKIPNKETVDVIKDSRSNKNMEIISLNDLKNSVV